MWNGIELILCDSGSVVINDQGKQHEMRDGELIMTNDKAYITHDTYRRVKYKLSNPLEGF